MAIALLDAGFSPAPSGTRFEKGKVPPHTFSLGASNMFHPAGITLSITLVSNLAVHPVHVDGPAVRARAATLSAEAKLGADGSLDEEWLPLAIMGLMAWGWRRRLRSGQHKKQDEPPEAGVEEMSEPPPASAHNDAAEVDWHTEMLLADLLAVMPDLHADLEEPDTTPATGSAEQEAAPDPQGSANAVPGHTGHTAPFRARGPWPGSVQLPVNNRADAPHSATCTGCAASAPIRIQARRHGSPMCRIGRYVIEQEIAADAAGTTYGAWDPKSRCRVVIKASHFCVRLPDGDGSALSDDIYRQISAVTKLNHPNIAAVLDINQEDGFCYVVSEYLLGTNLRRLLEREHHLPWELALWIAMQACSALHYAHSTGIIHLNIKPNNLVLLPQENKIKMLDFGLAMATRLCAALDANNARRQEAVLCGTPGYMAPEQMVGDRLDGRADIFALGVVLYELLTGRRPFVGKNAAALVHRIRENSYLPPSLQNIELPGELDAVIERALDSRPEHRFQTAAEFDEALKNCQVAVLRE